jgi:uncharacterized SAM-binding protein YcdF (DUF218 family)
VSYINFVFPLFVALAALGLLYGWRMDYANRTRPLWLWLATAGAVGCLLLAYFPLAWLLVQPLEAGYAQNPVPREEAKAFVVLAGGVDPPGPDRPFSSPQPQTYERCRETAWLYKHWKALPILASGGGSFNEPLSFTMRHLLESEGIPPDQIWLESRSHSTYEGALYGCPLLRARGISEIVLVDEARFLPRAVATFRKQGMKVVPAPFNFTHLYWEADNILPTARAISLNGETLHEYLGLTWYKLRGRI